MRPPPRTLFHHSDLGGPYLAFAPEYRDSDQDLNRAADSNRPLFYPTRLQRSSVLSMLIDALRRRRFHDGPASTNVNHPRKAAG